MIVTIIPYFLLANLRADDWKNGAEFKFHSAVGTYAEGFLDNTLTKGLNITNELVCRPKQTDTLKCEFRNVYFNFYEFNKTSDSLIKQSKLEDALIHVYEKVPFEIKFNREGVESVVVTEDASKSYLLDFIKSAANLLNVGVNLAELKLNPKGEPYNFRKKLNFMLGECESNIGIIFLDHLEDHRKSEFKLDLVAPIEKLNGRELLIGKLRNDVNCVSGLKYFWNGIMLDELHQDSHLKVANIIDRIRIDPDQFYTLTEMHLETVRDGDEIKIHEGFLLYLSDIYAAKGELRDIPNPVRITFNNDSEDENKICGI